MSEYQRYEFMTSDRPLTPAQLDAVRTLSSPIEVSSTHAFIEYHQSRPFERFRDLFDSLLKSEPLARLSLAASCEGHLPCLHSG